MSYTMWNPGGHPRSRFMEKNFKRKSGRLSNQFICQRASQADREDVDMRQNLGKMGENKRIMSRRLSESLEDVLTL